MKKVNSSNVYNVHTTWRREGLIPASWGHILHFAFSPSQLLVDSPHLLHNQIIPFPK